MGAPPKAIVVDAFSCQEVSRRGGIRSLLESRFRVLLGGPETKMAFSKVSSPVQIIIRGENSLARGFNKAFEPLPVDAGG